MHQVHSKDVWGSSSVQPGDIIPRPVERSRTGAMSPDQTPEELGTNERILSLRSSNARMASLRATSLREGIVGGEGVMLKPGDGGTIGLETFEGGLVQGKKAPGETVSCQAFGRK